MHIWSNIKINISSDLFFEYLRAEILSMKISKKKTPFNKVINLLDELAI